MMWYGSNWGWGAWSLMTVGMVAFWALLITSVVLVVRYLVTPSAAAGALDPKSAEDLLAERYCAARSTPTNMDSVWHCCVSAPHPVGVSASTLPTAPIGWLRNPRET